MQYVYILQDAGYPSHPTTCRMQDIRRRISVAGCRISVAGYPSQDAGYPSHPTTCRMQDIRRRMQDIRRRISVSGCRISVASYNMQDAGYPSRLSCRIPAVPCLHPLLLNDACIRVWGPSPSGGDRIHAPFPVKRLLLSVAVNLRSGTVSKSRGRNVGTCSASSRSASMFGDHLLVEGSYTCILSCLQLQRIHVWGPSPSGGVVYLHTVLPNDACLQL